MATVPATDLEQVEPKLSSDEAARELYKIVEAHYDAVGLSESERDERYAKAREYLDATDAAPATA